jgi:hypothetical protein
MSVLEDLQAGLAAIKQAVADAAARIHELLDAQASARQADDSAAVESIAVELKATAASLEAIVNPPPAPAPEAAPAAADPAAAPAEGQ